MTTRTSPLPIWTLLAPATGWLLLAGKFTGLLSGWPILLAAGLLFGVLAAVHHAEVVAHKVGEPFGTLVLAGAITAIEVALIVTLMISGGSATSALARDTIFATVMLILNGIVGLCLLAGGQRFGEQRFSLLGVNAALSTLAAIVTLTLILPNFTTTVPGPLYNARQLGFVAVASVVLYAAFVFIQTVRHRDYFLPEEGAGNEHVHAAPPTGRVTLISLTCLVAGLAAVVLLAKAISPQIEAAVAGMGAPPALVGVIIAAIVLLPEGLAAWRAARANRLQTSLNLALGSALASIGLSIPAVAVVSIYHGWPLTLGIDAKSTVLLVLSLLIATLSLGNGRTTILQGVVHLALFATYLFLTIFP
ncbi:MULTISPECIES: calcium:proton antiporter [unclassified Paludibacterium]|uniref:calcium:proton antiporter n=1 Tax=unclassified Paludibacterium TaxID=2618429 RepID=UPI001C0499BD|nr:ionic transporter y4hA [Paludibacterium sp. B53371]BEV72416.1 ionic transporter y4hA [Paludibacterium sp. THUN1379]